MLRILSEKVSISIRKHKYAAVPFHSAEFAPSVTRQPCVAYRIYVTGTYALTRIETGSQRNCPTRRCALGDPRANWISSRRRAWHGSGDLHARLDFGSSNQTALNQ